MNLEYFVEKSNRIHQDKYDYSNVILKKGNDKVSIICPRHGRFEQKASSHLEGCGCPECAKELRIQKIHNRCKEEFEIKSREIHGDKYDYSQVEYKSNKDPVIIVCPYHGEFYQQPSGHLGGSGCPDCYREKQRKNVNSLIQEFKEIHGNFYDYSQVEYKTSKEKIKVICPYHGEFFVSPPNHKKGRGCKICSRNKLSKERRNNQDDFISRAKEVHNNFFDYSNIEYISLSKKVEIVCPYHGEFKQTPHHHLEGNGCPRCRNSKGEKEIEKFFDNHNIKYTSQKRFNGIEKWPFDFYLPQYNLVIEYDGIQHYEPRTFGSINKSNVEKVFQVQIERDKFKNS